MTVRSADEADEADEGLIVNFADNPLGPGYYEVIVAFPPGDSKPNASITAVSVISVSFSNMPSIEVNTVREVSETRTTTSNPAKKSPAFCEQFVNDVNKNDFPKGGPRFPQNSSQRKNLVSPCSDLDSACSFPYSQPLIRLYFKLKEKELISAT
jgi:hypothetical protein